MKKTKVGRTGHSREASNTKSNKQGANIGSLEGVLDFGASNSPSGGSKSLPVERGGGVREGKKEKQTQFVGEVATWTKTSWRTTSKNLSHRRQGSKKGSHKESTGGE